jgi:hypothetical protein
MERSIIWPFSIFHFKSSNLQTKIKNYFNAKLFFQDVHTPNHFLPPEVVRSAHIRKCLHQQLAEIAVRPIAWLDDIKSRPVKKSSSLDLVAQLCPVSGSRICARTCPSCIGAWALATHRQSLVLGRRRRDVVVAMQNGRKQATVALHKNEAALVHRECSH